MGTAVGLAWPAAFTRAACGGCRCEFIEKLHCLSCGPGTARALVTERCCAAVLRSVPCAGPEGAAGLARGAILPEGPAVLRPSKGAAALWCSRGVPQRRTGAWVRCERCTVHPRTLRAAGGDLEGDSGLAVGDKTHLRLHYRHRARVRHASATIPRGVRPGRCALAAQCSDIGLGATACSETGLVQHLRTDTQAHVQARRRLPCWESCRRPRAVRSYSWRCAARAWDHPAPPLCGQPESVPADRR